MTKVVTTVSLDYEEHKWAKAHNVNVSELTRMELRRLMKDDVMQLKEKEKEVKQKEVEFKTAKQEMVENRKRLEEQREIREQALEPRLKEVIEIIRGKLVAGDPSEALRVAGVHAKLLQDVGGVFSAEELVARAKQKD